MSVQEILTAIEQLPPEQQQRVHDALDVQQEVGQGDVQKAVAGIRALRKGNRRPEGMTIKAMVEEGRC